MRKIRIAQIGLNQHSHGRMIFETLTKFPEIFDIAGFALVEDERETCAKQLHVFEGYPELSLQEILDDPAIEAVTVETDEIHLCKYAKMAAEHGKHIHMEKPGGATLAEFEALVDALKRAGNVFSVGYMYRYNPLIRELIDRVKRGELGDIYSVEADMSRMDGEVLRTWLGTLPGGMMFYLGCHLIDLVVQILGFPQHVVPLSRASGQEGIDSLDMGLCVMEYPHAVATVKTTDVEMGGFKRRKLVVAGSKGTVELCPLENCAPEDRTIISTVRTEYTVRDFHEPGKVSEVGGFGRYEEMMQTFAACVRGERENPYTYDYELQLFRTVLQCCGL
ncbi:MAG: Gfo/Idh/MocA family oxidoreductase [Clostridia bacterium]|nr:Gfo/Idh/MocA family oxidoreductase [Clostridia bacterium]